MEHEREIVILVRKDILKWLLEKLTTIPEPIVVIGESVYAIFLGHSGLLVPYYRNAQVIEAKVSWNTRLSMTLKEGFCKSYIGPLGKTLPIPFVILRNRMELR